MLEDGARGSIFTFTTRWTIKGCDVSGNGAKLRVSESRWLRSMKGSGSEGGMTETARAGMKKSGGGWW
jgi:hypothetical protein